MERNDELFLERKGGFRETRRERVTGTEHRPKIQKARECGGLVEREKGNSLERKREGVRQMGWQVI